MTFPTEEGDRSFHKAASNNPVERAAIQPPERPKGPPTERPREDRVTKKRGGRFENGSRQEPGTGWLLRKKKKRKLNPGEFVRQIRGAYVVRGNPGRRGKLAQFLHPGRKNADRLDPGGGQRHGYSKQFATGKGGRTAV